MISPRIPLVALSVLLAVQLIPVDIVRNNCIRNEATEDRISSYEEAMYHFRKQCPAPHKPKPKSTAYITTDGIESAENKTKEDPFTADYWKENFSKYSGIVSPVLSDPEFQIQLALAIAFPFILAIFKGLAVSSVRRLKKQWDSWCDLYPDLYPDLDLTILDDEDSDIPLCPENKPVIDRVEDIWPLPLDAKPHQPGPGSSWGSWFSGYTTDRLAKLITRSPPINQCQNCKDGQPCPNAEHYIDGDESVDEKNCNENKENIDTDIQPSVSPVPGKAVKCESPESDVLNETTESWSPLKKMTSSLTDLVFSKPIQKLKDAKESVIDFCQVDPGDISLEISSFQEGIVPTTPSKADDEADVVKEEATPEPIAVRPSISLDHAYAKLSPQKKSSDHKHTLSKSNSVSEISMIVTEMQKANLRRVSEIHKELQRKSAEELREENEAETNWKNIARRPLSPRSLFSSGAVGVPQFSISSYPIISLYFADFNWRETVSREVQMKRQENMESVLFSMLAYHVTSTRHDPFSVALDEQCLHYILTPVFSSHVKHVKLDEESQSVSIRNSIMKKWNQLQGKILTQTPEKSRSQSDSNILNKQDTFPLFRVHKIVPEDEDSSEFMSKSESAVLISCSHNGLQVTNNYSPGVSGDSWIPEGSSQWRFMDLIGLLQAEPQRDSLAAVEYYRALLVQLEGIMPEHHATLLQMRLQQHMHSLSPGWRDALTSVISLPANMWGKVKKSASECADMFFQT